MQRNRTQLMTNDVRLIPHSDTISGKKSACEHRCCSPEADEAKNGIHKKKWREAGDASPREGVEGRKRWDRGRGSSVLHATRMTRTMSVSLAGGMLTTMLRRWHRRSGHVLLSAQEPPFQCGDLVPQIFQRLRGEGTEALGRGRRDELAAELRDREHGNSQPSSHHAERMEFILKRQMLHAVPPAHQSSERLHRFLPGTMLATGR